MHDDRTCGSSASVPSAYPAHANPLASRSGRTGAEHRPFRSGPAGWPLGAAAGIMTASGHRAGGRESPGSPAFLSPPRDHPPATGGMGRCPREWGLSSSFAADAPFRPGAVHLETAGDAEAIRGADPGANVERPGDDHHISGGAGGAGLTGFPTILMCADRCCWSGRSWWAVWAYDLTSG